MSYLKTIEYRMIPAQSYTILRNCSGCGQKSSFKNTGKFRINANGNKLDVWLVYQCEKCRHTFNLTIYERRKNTSIPTAAYRRFLGNDEQLAEEYGRNLQLFQKNKAEVDTKNVNYELVKLQETIDETACDNQTTLITIHNPYSLKIRPEKLIAQILGLSSSQAKKLIAKETITIKSTIQSICIFVSDQFV
ncbi:MAG: DUF1062 domain-containing protein [Lachnospiraceae bacterium]|nr:DUF1062 domain-containing protein [Lachnospiraceae bacterium]